jgi:hypothetical protein
VSSTSDQQVEPGVTAQAFAVSTAPYLVLDRTFRIRAVNAAYERATLQSAKALVGRHIFDAFPDNPGAPEAHSVDNLGRSLETVFRCGITDRMPIQRYDVPSPTGDGSFVLKVWSPTNTPLRATDGTVTAILHHVEDVTAAVDDASSAYEATPASDRLEQQLMVALAHEQQISDALRKQNEHLQVALQSNRQIGMALGILMFSHKITAEAAFDMLRKASQRANRKLRDVADEVIELGCVGS